MACGDQRRLTGNGSALEVVLHDYALYKSTFTLLYLLTLDEQIQAVQEKGIILAQNELSEIQSKKLVNLLYRNLDSFATGMRDLVGTDVMYHSIDTGTAEPVRKTAYRQSPEMMREMQRQVNDMMRAGIVEESESPWSSSCLFI